MRLITPDPKPVSAPKVRKPLARRRATPRRTKSQCLTLRCKTTPIHIGRCGKHADWYLLSLRRAIVVKSGECELAEWHRSFMQCSGPICDNHGLDRGYRRGNLRWDPQNGFSGCSGVNYWAKYHPLEWHDFLRRTWGVDVYMARVEIALRGEKPDYEKAEKDLLEWDVWPISVDPW